MFYKTNNTSDRSAKYGHFKNKFEQKFGRLRDEFMNGEHPFAGACSDRKNNIPANISENEEFFTLQLYAAGYQKDRFKVAVKDNVLTVSYDPSEEETPVAYMYQEFSAGAFERSFQLSNQVSTSRISASYEDGILTVILPKDLENITPPQEIRVG
ncbi:Hsp20/alpha crystallin family protein [Sphingobacterium spiritivorum]|uniref:Hsp20/alpha crystallin family protein n=1 Tax=Sphingobacterium spiritivorum TaxID=258 RepID=UPI003DA2DC0C